MVLPLYQLRWTVHGNAIIDWQTDKERCASRGEKNTGVCLFECVCEVFKRKKNTGVCLFECVYEVFKRRKAVI